MPGARSCIVSGMNRAVIMVDTRNAYGHYPFSAITRQVDRRKCLHLLQPKSIYLMAAGFAIRHQHGFNRWHGKVCVHVVVDKANRSATVDYQRPRLKGHIGVRNIDLRLCGDGNAAATLISNQHCSISR